MLAAAGCGFLLILLTLLYLPGLPQSPLLLFLHIPNHSTLYRSIIIPNSLHPLTTLYIPGFGISLNLTLSSLIHSIFSFGSCFNTGASISPTSCFCFRETNGLEGTERSEVPVGPLVSPRILLLSLFYIICRNGLNVLPCDKTFESDVLPCDKTSEPPVLTFKHDC